MEVQNVNFICVNCKYIFMYPELDVNENLLQVVDTCYHKHCAANRIVYEKTEYCWSHFHAWLPILILTDCVAPVVQETA